MELVTDEFNSEVVEREIDRTELYASEEVFLCGTGAEVTPVVEIDGRTVGTGKVGESTKRLQELYFAMARGDDPQRTNGLVPVY